MRKFLISIISIFIGFSAYCAGKNIPTSKSYVDSALVPKQDIIDRTTGNPKVLTNTGTAGEYETKDIYDSTASYGGQSDALIDAVTMNTAVQNAIDTEFVCIEWVDPNDHTSDCLLMDIRGAAPRRSPNLFDVSKVPTRDLNGVTKIINNGDGSLTVTRTSETAAVTTRKKLSQLAPELVVGQLYTLSFHHTLEGGDYILLINSGMSPRYEKRWYNGTNSTLSQNDLDANVYFIIEDIEPCTISQIQIERGTVATPYQPYGNIYLPVGQ